MKHTSGPWTWVVNPTCKQVTLVGGKGMDVLRPARWGMQSAQVEWVKDGLYYPMMEFFKAVPGREHHKHWFGTIDHPNARLIAAAPELLEVAKEVMKQTDSEYDWFKVRRMAKEAIARAEGVK